MVNTVSHGNGTTDTYGKDPYDMRRPASIDVRGGLGMSLWSSGTYAYDGTGNIKAIGADSYVYDKVSRIILGTVSYNVNKKQCYVYDAFGNIKGQATVASSSTCTPSPIAVSSATNRLEWPVSYDGAGNQLTWNSGVYQYHYYPTSQMRMYQTGARNLIYAYSVDGERIAWNDSAEGGVRYTIRDLSGKVLREFWENGGVFTWTKDYIYRDGQLLATVEPSGVKHLHLDHLGTPRVISNTSANAVAVRHFFPFGQEATAANAERMKFTGHERDFGDPTHTTDDLDYMHARHYNPVLGRFLSLDPVGGSVASGQSWNRYAYVHNNPLRKIDPTGKYGKDVHLYLMYYLAGVAGYDSQQARALAEANQAVDDDTPAINLFRPSNWKKHFSGNEEAVALFWASPTFASRGAALHTVMDSYSHKGPYFWPLGHALSNIFGRSPDEPWRRPEQFAARVSQLVTLLGGDPSAVDHGLVTRFVAARSKQERIDILRAAGVPELEERQGRIQGIQRVNQDVIRVNGCLRFVTPGS